MKSKWALLIVIALVLSFAQIGGIAAATKQVIVLYNNDDTSVGAGWSTNGSIPIDIEDHPVAANGKAVKISSSKKTLYHGRAITAAYYGDMKIEFDMYQTARSYETNFQIRRFELTAGDQKFDKKLVQLSNGGMIKVDGVNTAWAYKANENYKFKVLINTVDQTYEVFLVSGMVSSTIDGAAILKENISLASGNLLASFAGISAFQFNGSQADSNLSYIDNFKMTANEVNVAVPQIIGGIVSEGVNQFNINMNQFIDTSTLSGFSVIKNGIPLTSSEYSTSFSSTVTGTSLSKNMSLTLADMPEVGDEFTFAFGTMTDTFGRTFNEKNVSLTIEDLSNTDSSILGITGYEDLVIDSANNTISGIVKGYPSQPVFDNVVLANAGAQKALLDVYGKDVTDTKTALYEGDKIKVIAADGINERIYTIVEKPAVFANNFNNADTEFIVHNGNRNAPNYTKLYPSETGWSNIYIASGPNPGVDAYAASGKTGIKDDISAKLVLNEFINEVSSSKDNAIWKDLQITQGNNYVVSVSIKPMDINSSVQISWRAGKYNSGSFLPSPIAFSQGGTIGVFGDVVGTYVPNNWYNVSVVIDTANKRIKSYINGKLVGETVIAQNILDAWVDSEYIAVRLTQTAPGMATTTSSVYFDNYSINELYSVNVQPDNYSFIPTSEFEIIPEEGKIACPQGVTAEQILSSLGGYPEAYLVNVYSSDEKTVLTGEIDLESNSKLIFKYGEKVVSYSIVKAEEYKLYINDVRAYKIGNGTNKVYLNHDSGIYILALYDETNKLISVKTTDLEVTNELSIDIESDANKKNLKIMRFEDLNNLNPLGNAILIQDN